MCLWRGLRCVWQWEVQILDTFKFQTYHSTISMAHIYKSTCFPQTEQANTSTGKLHFSLKMIPEWLHLSWPIERARQRQMNCKQASWVVCSSAISLKITMLFSNGPVAHSVGGALVISLHFLRGQNNNRLMLKAICLFCYNITDDCRSYKEPSI